MSTNAHRDFAVRPQTSEEPRVVLAHIRAARAVLDGGWWPRSWDPTAELPGLLDQLAARYGRIWNVTLHNGTWDGRFSRITVEGEAVRVGWFVSVDPALMVVTTYGGVQIDLLIVPPGTDEAIAQKAMATAADPANKLRAPHLLESVGVADGNGHVASRAS